MDKTKQDKEWSRLKPEYQELERKMYLNMKQCSVKGYWDEFIKTKEEQYGIHNLNPQPQIKTWADVAIYKPEIWDDINRLGREIGNYAVINTGLYNKLVATIHIQQLIDLGYGGCISEEEWKDADIVKHCVVRDGSGLRHCCFTTDYEFLAFHTSQQFEEFMSYEENRRLAEKYFAMN